DSPPTWLFRWCPDEQATALVAGAPPAASPGTLGAILDIGWDAPRAPFARPLFSLAHRLTGKRERGPDPGARTRYAAALTAAAARHGRAPAWALEALVALHPRALDSALPAAERRAAALALLAEPSMATRL